MEGISVRPTDILSATAQNLIRELNAELSARYQEPGSNHFRLGAEEVAPGRGAFLVAYGGTQPLGCGAVRRLSDDTAEIKRMYVAVPSRGRGVGRSLLQALEHEARALGANRLVLETGERQPEAIALYERAGFQRIAPFGEYVDSPASVCMSKGL
jgi:GNAT superfamily N-acetyltransferase